ncbi:hypothetical protein BH18ACI3_BH18ACI3_13540 [soil metagenome]
METVQNTASNNGIPASNQSLTPSAPMPVNSSTPPAAANRPDEQIVDNVDFEGTAGIIEKKNVNIKANGVMSAVRSARHGNYDRVVFEFLGPELPGYHLEYIDKPVRACGSGNVVPLAGDGWLEVRFTDAIAHAPEGDATIKDRERLPNLPIIKEMKITCDFEAEVTWVLGVSSPNHYRVLELKNPTRLAVDIKHK